MNISLNQEQEHLINHMVASGLYDSPDDAIDTAIRLLDQRNQKHAALRKDIQEGLDSGTGRLFDESLAEDIKRRGRELLAQRESPG
jgi:putative addiction module CopG family antidote